MEVFFYKCVKGFLSEKEKFKMQVTTTTNASCCRWGTNIYMKTILQYYDLQGLHKTCSANCSLTEVNNSLKLCAATGCVFNQVFDVCYSEHNKDKAHAVQLEAEDYVFLIGFLISVY